MKFGPGLKFEDATVQEKIGVFLDTDIHLISGEEERNTASHTDWVFRCTVCRCLIMGLHGAQNHMDGNRHKQNIIFTKTGEGEFMESKYKNSVATFSASKDLSNIDSIEIWDAETNEEIETKGNNDLDQQISSDNPTSGVPIPNKTQVPKSAHPYLTMQEKLTSLVEPIVGLESVVEHHIETGEMPPYYECQLCSSDMADANLINHLKGRSHRMNYLKIKNPEKHASISNLASYNVGRAMLSAIVELENEFGRGFMPIVIDKDVTKHPDSKNYQTLREKKKDDKNGQKRPSLMIESPNITNNKERKKKRGMIGKPTSISKGPVTNPTFIQNIGNKAFPSSNMNNYNNFPPNFQDPMGYYQNQYYQNYYRGQMQMGNNNPQNQMRQIPPINPELCPPTNNNQSILGAAPNLTNQPILGQAPTDNAPLLGVAPTTTVTVNQPILGVAPVSNNVGQGLIPTPPNHFATMMNSNPIMMNNNAMMNPNMMSQGQNNIMMGQGNTMMNNNAMMGQGTAMMNQGNAMLGQGNTMMMNNNNNMMMINRGFVGNNLNTMMNQTQGYNGNQINSLNCTSGLLPINQGLISGNQGLINSNSTGQNTGQALLPITTSNQLSSNIQTITTTTTSSLPGLLETPEPKDSLLGPAPATLFGEIKGKSQYNFISSKPQSIPLLGSDGQLTQNEGQKKSNEIGKERSLLLDTLATWEIKTEEEARAALKVINNLTKSLNQYKTKTATKTENLPAIHPIGEKIKDLKDVSEPEVGNQPAVINEVDK